MPGDQPQSPRWSALLMAGGESRRMGRDKAELVLLGEPLWRRQWRTLREVGEGSEDREKMGEIMIARGERAWGEQEGLTPIADATPGCGPLGGLLAGVLRMETPWLLVLAVDLPLMPPHFLRAMLMRAEREKRGVVPTNQGRYEPLAAVYSRECRALAREAMEAGERSLQKLVRRGVEAGAMCAAEVNEEERGFFRNMNTPEELAEVERQLRAA